MQVIKKNKQKLDDILLIYNENNKKFIEEENKITVYFIQNGYIKDIKFIWILIIAYVKTELRKCFT